MVQNTKGQQNRMKTEGGVVVVTYFIRSTNLMLLEVDIWIEKDQNASFFI